MDLRKFTDKQLLTSTRELVGAERQLVTSLLHHLNEIAARRLYAKESYPSLFEYCTRELGLSESQAHRRINCARMLKDFPRIESKITNGDLSLTNVALIHSFMKLEQRSRAEIEKLLTMIEKKSTREVEKLLATLAPKASKESRRPISGTRTELRFSVNQDVLEKMERLGCILSTNSLEEIVGKAVAVTLQKYDPLKKAERNLKTAKQRNASTAPKVNSRHIPAHVRHAVWIRDQGRCTFPGCASQFGLELDHIILFALGGPNTVENLRLRCRAHNQLHAQEQLGEKKMKQYRA